MDTMFLAPVPNHIAAIFLTGIRPKTGQQKRGVDLVNFAGEVPLHLLLKFR